MSIRNELRKNKAIMQIGGHGLHGKERFAPDTRHMIVCDITRGEASLTGPGGRIRIFLSDEGYGRAVESEKHGNIVIVRYYRVRNGDLIYQPRKAKHQQLEMDI